MSEKLTKHQVHKVAMQLLDRAYSKELNLNNPYALASKMAVLNFIHDLDAELDKEIEAWEILQKCAEKEQPENG